MKFVESILGFKSQRSPVLEARNSVLKMLLVLQPLNILLFVLVNHHVRKPYMVNAGPLRTRSSTTTSFSITLRAISGTGTVRSQRRPGFTTSTTHFPTSFKAACPH